MPRIGLLSDSHGRAPITRRAVEVLLDAGSQMLIHLGDVGGVEVLDALGYLQPRHGEAGDDSIEVRVVFGNTDYDKSSLHRYAEGIGLTVDDPVGCLELEPDEDQEVGEDGGEDGGEDRGSSRPFPHDSLVFMHGHDGRAMTKALKDGVRYLCHGHTHRSRDNRIGRTRVINPGALTRAQVYTVAVLDTLMDDLRFHEVGSR